MDIYLSHQGTRAQPKSGNRGQLINGIASRVLSGWLNAICTSIPNVTVNLFPLACKMRVLLELQVAITYCTAPVQLSHFRVDEVSFLAFPGPTCHTRDCSHQELHGHLLQFYLNATYCYL